MPSFYGDLGPFPQTPFLGLISRGVCYTQNADLKVTSAFSSLEIKCNTHVTHPQPLFSLPRARVKVYIRVHLRWTLDLRVSDPWIHPGSSQSEDTSSTILVLDPLNIPETTFNTLYWGWLLPLILPYLTVSRIITNHT